MLDRGTSAVISLPTGAGKTTMAELKIATALVSGTKVIYLVPTHALADQIKSQLCSAFPAYKVTGSALGDGFYSEIGEDDLPPLMVMTPERCLTLLGVMGTEFSKVGLVVFDECHLMHPKKGYAERRNVDAALCTLKLLEVAPDADFLLMSAMISNFAELADWIADATGRPAIPLGIEWKPTRQARGCLVIEADEYKSLETLLETERKLAEATFAKKTRKSKRSSPVPGTAVQRKLYARPLGFFCLQQTWNNNRKDYAVLPLSDGVVPLTANERWFITPNKNAVAVDLGSRFASLGIKTLVFIQHKGHCESVASAVATRLGRTSSAPHLTDSEKQMFEVAVEETGAPSAVLGNFDRLAVCHHGLLLPVERHLTESMFCRADGPALLTATPTLAQGMNLPAEVVIIAGDDRREEGSAKATPLEAHELLNAAGRAGRAGHVADGIVLVIPGDVVSIDLKDYRVGQKWFHLRDTVFAKTDQCLKVDDPIEHILDLIEVQVDPAETLIDYVVRRLPVDDDGGDANATKFLNRSLSAFRARIGKRAKAYDESVKAILKYRSKLSHQESVPMWRDRLSVSSGISMPILESLDTAMHAAESLPVRTSREWVDWFFVWLQANPKFALELFDCMALKKLLKEPLKVNETLPKILPQLITRLHPLVRGWMSGKPLSSIEKDMETPDNKLGTCDRARELVIRRMPEVSYAVGLATQVHRGFLESQGSKEEMPLHLATLAACVREGHKSPTRLAIQYTWGSHIRRVGCANVRRMLGTSAAPLSPTEPFRSLLKRVRKLIRDQV